MKMIGGNQNLQRSHLDHLTKSLEKLSMYDNGNRRAIQAAAKIDIQKILGDLNTETIKFRLGELVELEQKAIRDDLLDEAKRLNEEIKELREKEILLMNYLIIEENQRSFDNLRKINEKQIQEFNNKWEAIIYEITEDSKKIEREMVEQHKAERERLEEGILKVQMPHAKYSSELLDKKFKLKQMIKNKNFEAARELKEQIAIREEKEREEWINKFQKQLVKRKDLLAVQHKNEYKALKTRLEKTINSKLKQRMIEYEKLLQRIQNLQNEMTLQQALKFAKIQSTNAKLLAKYSLNLADLEERFADIPEESGQKTTPKPKAPQRRSQLDREINMVGEYLKPLQQNVGNDIFDSQGKEMGRLKSINVAGPESALEKAKSNLKQTTPGLAQKPKPTTKSPSVANQQPLEELKDVLPEKNARNLIQNVKAEEIFECSQSIECEESEPSESEGDEVPLETLNDQYVTLRS